MAYRIDPNLLNHPSKLILIVGFCLIYFVIMFAGYHYVNQSNFNTNNSSSNLAPYFAVPTHSFSHHYPAIQQTFSSQPPCRPAFQIHRWPTSGQIPHYAMIPQEHTVQYVHVPSQYSTRPMLTSPIYHSASQFCCSCTSILPHQSLALPSHVTGNSTSPTLIHEHSLTDAGSTCTPTVQIVVDEKDEAQESKTKKHEESYYVSFKTSL